jgi:hypothetical protein
MLLDMCCWMKWRSIKLSNYPFKSHIPVGFLPFETFLQSNLPLRMYFSRGLTRITETLIGNLATNNYSLGKYRSFPKNRDLTL